MAKNTSVVETACWKTDTNFQFIATPWWDGAAMDYKATTLDSYPKQQFEEGCINFLNEHKIENNKYVQIRFCHSPTFICRGHILELFNNTLLPMDEFFILMFDQHCNRNSIGANEQFACNNIFITDRVP